MRTTDVTPVTCPFLYTANICTGLIYKKYIKVILHRQLKKVTYKKTSQTQLKIINCDNITCHVHVIDVPRRGMELLLVLATAQLSLLVVQG